MISETDLIINPKGRIYHLDLDPEEIPDTIITVGDPGRVNHVSDHFDKVYFKRKHREFLSHLGKLGDKKLMVISTGIGTDNIDIVLNELDALVNIDFKTRTINKTKRSLNIIRIGTSGTIRKDIPIDSLLISDYALGIDSLMHFYSKNKKTIPSEMAKQSHGIALDLIQSAYWGIASPTLVKKISTPDFIHGITITSPGFYGPQGRSLRIKSTNFDTTSLENIVYKGLYLTNLEMETAGIYAMANALGHKSLSLNAILANRIEKKFSKNPRKTIDRLIKISLEQIEKL